MYKVKTRNVLKVVNEERSIKNSSLRDYLPIITAEVYQHARSVSLIFKQTDVQVIINVIYSGLWCHLNKLKCALNC